MAAGAESRVRGVGFATVEGRVEATTSTGLGPYHRTQQKGTLCAGAAYKADLLIVHS